MKLKCFAPSLFLLASALAASAQVKTLPETRNAALRYWQAFAEIKDPPPDKSTLDLMEKILAGQSAWNEATIAPVLDPNLPALGIFLRATSLPDCDWGLEYRRGPDASIAIVPRASVMARLNSLQAMREMANGHYDAAVDRWIAGLRFSQDLAHNGSLIFALTARSTLMANLRALSAATKGGHFNGSQKKRLFATVKAMPDDGFDWASTWGLEEAGVEVFFQQLRESKNPASLYESMMGQAPTSGCVPPSQKELSKYREYMFAVQAALREPPSTTKSRVEALEVSRTKLCPDAQNAIPSPQRINEARAEISAARQALMSAVAAK
jgi:hypothetical protein